MHRVKHTIPPLALTLAGFLTIHAVWHWWRWEPAAILTALGFLAIGILYDPEAGEHG